jgi:hypothetical protein
MVPSQLRHVPHAGSNACGFSHTRTNTSWVMSSAPAQSRVTRAASPYTSGESSSYNSPSAASSPATRRSQTSLSHRGCEDCSCSTQAAPLGSGQVIGPHSFLVRVNATVKGQLPVGRWATNGQAVQPIGVAAGCGLGVASGFW